MKKVAAKIRPGRIAISRAVARSSATAVMRIPSGLWRISAKSAAIIATETAMTKRLNSGTGSSPSMIRASISRGNGLGLLPCG